MEIEIGIDLRHESMREPLARRAAGLSWEHAVQILSVLRHDVNAASAEALHIENGQNDKGLSDALEFHLHQADGRFNRAELEAVDASGDKRARTRL
jgi:hypothetical protein